MSFLCNFALIGVKAVFHPLGLTPQEMLINNSDRAADSVDRCVCLAIGVDLLLRSLPEIISSVRDRMVLEKVVHFSLDVEGSRN